MPRRVDPQPGLHAGVWVRPGVWIADCVYIHVFRIPKRGYKQLLGFPTGATYGCLDLQPGPHMGVWSLKRAILQVVSLHGLKGCRKYPHWLNNSQAHKVCFLESEHVSETGVLAVWGHAFFNFFGPGTCPNRSEMAAGFKGADFQAKPSILGPFRGRFDVWARIQNQVCAKTWPGTP